MDKYGMILYNIIVIFDFKVLVIVSVVLQCCVCVLKVYKNLNNGEVVEIKGGNYKVLKVWKEQYGFEIVEFWL